MKTNKKKQLINKNSKYTKTRKHNKNPKPSLKILRKNEYLYASKKYSGDELLAYTRNNELKTHQYCDLDDINWFGSYEVAKSYQTKETKLNQFKIKNNVKLLRINTENDKFFRSLFLHSNIVLEPSIQISDEEIKKIQFSHPYLHMDNKEKAYYEFCFAFGYINIHEQNEFMVLLKYLIEEKIIHMEMRDGKSILNKLNLKINYYRLTHFTTKHEKYNRLSFYDLDKHALLNICKLLKARDLNIHGIFQKNTTSFWFPDLIVYKMNIEETILFNPHRDLVFDKVIEKGN